MGEALASWCARTAVGWPILRDPPAASYPDARTNSRLLTNMPSARELVRENRRNSQDRVDAFPVDGTLGWRLRLPD